MKIKKIVKASYLSGYAKTLLFILLFALSCMSCSKSVIFVSTDGDDLNPGSKRKPVATLGKALELSRSSVSKKIIIREGKYYDVSCTLSAIDSGLIISGETGKRVYLYGGKKLKNWQQHGDWWFADAPGTADRSWDFRILIVNDSLRSRARIPEAGEFTHKSDWPYKWQSSQGGWSKEPTREELTKMAYDPKDLGSWLDTRNAELTVFHAWDDSYVGLVGNDTINHVVRFTYPATHPAGAFASWIERASKYIVWNIKEGMKHPGQWYLDRTAEKVFYWPYPYEKISDIEALVPTQNQLFNFEKGARSIILENLSISCASAPMSNTGYGTTEIQGAIQSEGVSHLTLNNISVKNVAGWAIKIRGSEISISDGEFFNTGAGGINYDGNKISVERCGIHDVGKLYFGAVGINGAGRNNLVSHCELFNIPYAAISGVGNNSLADFNLIYNFKLELEDGGAIYSGSDSSVYRNNAALFKKSNTITGWTYYFDELSKNCIIEKNLAVNTLAPVHNHMANSITICNNIFIDQGKQTINSSLCSNVSFTGNIFVADTLVFTTPTGEPLSKVKSSYNYVFQKFYEANGIVEFKGNKLYCDKMLKAILHMYETNRVEDFDPTDNSLITGKNERELMRTTLPEAFIQTGYRGNFGEIFSTMTAN
ncbi:MAG: hypothetical protein IPN67_00260 [Bacteroidales bacterium]|nr:hypothetical protein [Bacteroidales bacterium]